MKERGAKAGRGEDWRRWRRRQEEGGSLWRARGTSREQFGLVQDALLSTVSVPLSGVCVTCDLASLCMRRDVLHDGDPGSARRFIRGVGVSQSTCACRSLLRTRVVIFYSIAWNGVVINWCKILHARYHVLHVCYFGRRPYGFFQKIISLESRPENEPCEV